MSLIQGEMPEGFKHAVVTPLPKKTDADPISKLLGQYLTCFSVQDD